MLAAELGHVVSMDRLVDGLWYDPPASAVNVVQVQVSHLRKQLPAPVRLETAGAGYRLDASARHVDLARFEALVNEAAAAERQGLAGANVEVLEEALALWKGDPLEGVKVLLLPAGEVFEPLPEVGPVLAAGLVQARESLAHAVEE